MTAQRVPVTRNCYATALRKASRRVSGLYDEILAPTGLRSTQFAILGELTDGVPQRPCEGQQQGDQDPSDQIGGPTFSAGRSRAQ